MKRYKLIFLLLLPFFSFAQLGTNNITITAVKTELGSSSTALSILCKDIAQNSWSKGGPAFLYAQGDSLMSKIPDGTTTDPRGSYRGSTKVLYHLADFRLYNHDADTVRFQSIVDVNLGSDEAGDSITKSINYWIGEVDWRQVDTTHATLNNLTSTNHFWILVDGVAYAKTDITALADNTKVFDQIKYKAGIQGSSTHVDIELAVGNSSAWVYKIGNANGSNGTNGFTSTVASPPDFTTPDVSGVTGATFLTKVTSGVRLGNTVSCDLTISEAERVVTITIFDGVTQIGQVVGQSLTPTTSNIVISVSPVLQDGSTYDTVVVDFP